jgi:anti-anti-sigma factor
MLEVTRGPGQPGVPVHRFGARTAVVRLAGRCDAAEVEDVIAAVVSVVEDNRTMLVVDLTDVRSIDAAFLTALHDLRGAGDRYGWEVVLVRPLFRHIWRYFEMTALGQSFRHFAGQGAALEYALARESTLGR